MSGSQVLRSMPAHPPCSALHASHDPPWWQELGGGGSSLDPQPCPALTHLHKAWLDPCGGAGLAPAPHPPNSDVTSKTGCFTLKFSGSSRGRFLRLWSGGGGRGARGPRPRGAPVPWRGFTPPSLHTQSPEPARRRYVPRPPLVPALGPPLAVAMAPVRLPAPPLAAGPASRIPHPPPLARGGLAQLQERRRRLARPGPGFVRPRALCLRRRDPGAPEPTPRGAPDSPARVR